MSVPPASRQLAERASAAVLQRQIEYFADSSITRHLLDAIPTLLLILNQQRQIVFLNQTVLGLIDDTADGLHGLRPGEALQCVHAETGEGGCGTSAACGSCGMLNSILISLAGRREVRECRFLRRLAGRTEAVDLLVWATPLDFRGETFTVFSLNDISHEKRRRALERIFFHDILNVAGSIKGFSELLCDREPVDRQEIYAIIRQAADQMIDEIDAQRTLAVAESKELVVNPESLIIPFFLQQMVKLYCEHEVAKERRIVLVEPLPADVLVTDRVLLSRILGNMLKNALEAAEPGETVTLRCRRHDGTIEFSIHNRAVILAALHYEIFQRSFSTKGAGRGLGTYSMKILSEYLGGAVSFSSDDRSGTTFRLRLPMVLS